MLCICAGKGSNSKTRRGQKQKDFTPFPLAEPLQSAPAAPAAARQRKKAVTLLCLFACVGREAPSLSLLVEKTLQQACHLVQTTLPQGCHLHWDPIGGCSVDQILDPSISKHGEVDSKCPTSLEGVASLNSCPNRTLPGVAANLSKDLWSTAI